LTTLGMLVMYEFGVRPYPALSKSIRSQSNYDFRDCNLSVNGLPGM